MKKLMVIGEAWGEKEEELGEPFVGPSGRMLKSYLKNSKIDLRDCYFTNVFNFRPQPSNNIENLCGPKSEALPGRKALVKGKYVRAEFAEELIRLEEEIKTVQPNCILALGSTALWAVLNETGIKKMRGAPTITANGVKVLPTYHPSAVLREYKLRPIVWADFSKVEREMEFPELIRPAREFWLRPSIQDLALFETKHILPAEELSVDIETWDRQITCIGFAPSEELAIVIPFCSRAEPDGNYWRSFQEERIAWDYVRRWLNLGKRIYGQNFLYDISYLWPKMRIPLHEVTDDTMLAHHAMQPEMEKGLGFLGSIYTNEPSWKFMRTDIKTLKKED